MQVIPVSIAESQLKDSARKTRKSVKNKSKLNRIVREQMEKTSNLPDIVKSLVQSGKSLKYRHNHM